MDMRCSNFLSVANWRGRLHTKPFLEERHHVGECRRVRCKRVMRGIDVPRDFRWHTRGDQLARIFLCLDMQQVMLGAGDQRRRQTGKTP
jgi:hypothetical protein